MIGKQAVLGMARGGTTAVKGLVVAALLGVLPTVAHTQPSEPAKAHARTCLRDGNALLEQGRAADALAKFTEAYRLFPSPKLHYNIGQAESQLSGHETQAYEEMSRFLSDAKDANPELRAAAETQRRQLRSKVGLVTVVAEPAGAELVVDGARAGRELAEISREAPLVLCVGTHKLTIRKGAVVSTPETVTITGGDDVNVRLSLAAPATASPTPVAAARLPLVVPGPLLVAPADGTGTTSSRSSMLVAAPAETRADPTDRFRVSTGLVLGCAGWRRHRGGRGRIPADAILGELPHAHDGDAQG
jgi:hypothetical protein